MFEDMPAPREDQDDIVVVHHLIRTLGRRPTPTEIDDFRQQQSRGQVGASGPPLIPGQRVPGHDHR